jgi:hypothetical protein
MDGGEGMGTEDEEVDWVEGAGLQDGAWYRKVVRLKGLGEVVLWLGHVHSRGLAEGDVR